MKLIMRYLKPFSVTLFIAVVFLFIQVISELGLPRLMSEIVDTGIQAGGIDEIAPTVLTEDAMELLQLFLDETESTVLLDGYRFVDVGIEQQIINDFPLAESSAIHQLREQSEIIDGLYARAVHSFALSQQADSSESGSFDKLKELKQWLPQLHEQKVTGQLEAAIAAATSAAAGDSLAGKQTATQFTQVIYEQLGFDLKQHQQSYIIKLGLTMLAVAALGAASSVVIGWLSAKLATSVGMRLRRDIFHKVSTFSKSEFEKFSTATLITRSTNDVQQVQQLILTGLRLILFAPLLGIGGIILAIRSSLSLSWIIAVAVISIVGIIAIIFSIAVPKFKILQQLIDKINLISRENLSGMMVIRAFGNEQYEGQRFLQANDQLRKTNRFVQRTMAFQFPAMMLVMNLISVLIVWVGAKEIAASQLQLGNMIAFMQYATIIIMSFLLLSMMFLMIPRAIASAERIQEVLQTEVSITEPAQAQVLDRSEGVTISFNNVAFSYGDAEEPVLEGISFTATPGKTTAFIGSTGSGKSTLINLIPRFYDVSSGSIMLNGIDIRELSLYELRDMIGYVPQKGSLFSGNITSNVCYGKEGASDTEITEALEIAQASQFVEKLEQGVHSPIAQGGGNVSGGHRQRLSIARALIKRAPIYIFDDSFSALDYKTDAALRKVLQETLTTSTVLVVAQRISTIKNADQIIVLEKGRIVDKGTHHELLSRCEAYQEIALSQLTKEELA